MPIIEECCVLIPCHTLEDFPSSVSSTHARSLLAAWSAPWDPRLIAATGKIPTWCRADVPPTVLDGLTLFIPEISESRLPSDFSTTHSTENGVRSIRATSRAGFLEPLCLSEFGGPSEPLSGGHREVAPADFYSLAYVFLQVQLMTRQLRYTSNLDEVQFADVVVAAAKAWQASDGTAAADSLHQAFDMLAEERDHYFSSDPHLIDLTLVAKTTLGDSLEEVLGGSRPDNLLLDAELVELLAVEHPQRLQQIQSRREAGTLGVAGGAPAAGTCLDHLTIGGISKTLTAAKNRFEEVLGTSPDAFAGLQGGIPTDLAPWIAELGYTGVIPIDFAAGSGHREESKLLWQAGAVDLEALVAKPIDAADESEFLRLGARLGSAVDAGDVATALLVHWPGQSCDSFTDLKRASDWGVALGKFWTLGDYFSDGERPYHSFHADAVEATGQWLTSQVQEVVENPLTNAASGFRKQVVAEENSLLNAMKGLVGGTPTTGTVGPANQAETRSAANGLLATLAAVNTPSESKPAAVATAIVNPHSIPLRVAATLKGHPPAIKPPVFAGHAVVGGESVAFVDVPAFGFVNIQPGTSPARQSWFKKPPRRADGRMMSNEFLDVVIGEDGSVASVHSGPVRGNRFSMQLCLFDADREPRYTSMQAEHVEMTRSDGAVGEVRCQGRMIHGDQSMGTFEVCYRVECGSRLLIVEGEVNLAKSVTLGSNPWRNYVAARAAVASEASRTKVLLRDKVQTVRGRMLNSPLGVVVDEPDRQLLVMANGRPAHRASGTRMLDTLLMVKGQSDGHFRIAYGFDVKSPVAFARAQLAPPVILGPADRTPEAEQLSVPLGWLIQVDARNVLITEATTTMAEGKLQLHLLLVETRGKRTKTRLHTYRDPKTATRLPDGKPFDCEDDNVKVILGEHETLRLTIDF